MTDASAALPHVRRLRNQHPGINLKKLHQMLVKIKALDKLDLKTLKEIIKQEDAVLPPSSSTKPKPSSSSSSSTLDDSAPAPPLSTRALRLLSTSIFLHEKAFLHQLPDLYPPLYTQPAAQSIYSQSLRFEVVAFAAALKQAVLIGWGDGKRPKHAKAAAKWQQMVWKDGVMGDYGGDAGESLAKRDPAAREVKRFVDSCEFRIVPDAVTDKDYVITGHTLLFRRPASADVVQLLANADDSTSPAPIIPESLMARILDYPVPFPSDSAPPSHSNRAIIVTYGEQFRTASLFGTQYTAVHPLDSRLIQAHFERYRTRLRGGLFGIVELCLDGVWAGDKKDQGQRRTYKTEAEAVKDNTEEWARLMNPSDGFARLEDFKRRGPVDRVPGTRLREFVKSGSNAPSRSHTPVNVHGTVKIGQSNAPLLTLRAMELLSTSLYLHEQTFLPLLPSLYGRSSTNAHFQGQGHRFEILQFACGLKPAVFIEHTSTPGGPSDPEYATATKDKAIGGRWVDHVWIGGLQADLRAWEAAASAPTDDDSSREVDPDVQLLQEWVSGCRITVIGNVRTNAGFALTGHRLLYHSLAASQPIVRILSNSTRPIPSTSTDPIADQVILPEFVFAKILDYPVPFPMMPDAQQWEKRIIVSLGEGFQSGRTFFGTAGTTFVALERDHNTPTMHEYVRKYQQALDGSLFGPVSLCWGGTWDRPQTEIDPLEGSVAVESAWKVWSGAMDRDAGFSRLVALLRSGHPNDPKLIRDKLAYGTMAELNGSPVPDEDASPFAVREVDENEGGKDETPSGLDDTAGWADVLHPTSTGGGPTALQVRQAAGTALGFRLSGDANFKARQLPDAVADYTIAIDWEGDGSPSDAQLASLLIRRAATELKLWNLQKAYEDCDEAIEFDPSSIRAHACSCFVSMELEEYGRVTTLAAKALRLPLDAAAKADPRLLDLLRKCHESATGILAAKRAAALAEIEERKRAEKAARAEAEAKERAARAAEEAKRKAEKDADDLKRKIAREAEEAKRRAAKEAAELKRKKAAAEAAEAKRKADANAAEERRIRDAHAEAERVKARKAAEAAEAAVSLPPPTEPASESAVVAGTSKKAKKRKAKKTKKAELSGSSDEGMPGLVAAKQTGQAIAPQTQGQKPPQPAKKTTKQDADDTDDSLPGLISTNRPASSANAAVKPVTPAPKSGSHSDEEPMPSLLHENTARKSTALATKPAGKPTKSSPAGQPEVESDTKPAQPSVDAFQSTVPPPAAAEAEAEDGPLSDEDDAGSNGSESMPELLPVTSNKSTPVPPIAKKPTAAPTPAPPPPRPTPAPAPKAQPRPTGKPTNKKSGPPPPPRRGLNWSGTDSTDSMVELTKAQLPKQVKRKRRVKPQPVESESDWGVLIPIPPPPPPQPKAQAKAQPKAPSASLPTPPPTKASPPPAASTAKAGTDDDVPDLIEVKSQPNAKMAVPTAAPPASFPAPSPSSTATSAPAAEKPAAVRTVPNAKGKAKAKKATGQPIYRPPTSDDDSETMPGLFPAGQTAHTPKTAPSTSAKPTAGPTGKANTKTKAKANRNGNGNPSGSDSDALPSLQDISNVTPNEPPKKAAPKQTAAQKAAAPETTKAAEPSADPENSDSDSGIPPMVAIDPQGNAPITRKPTVGSAKASQAGATPSSKASVPTASKSSPPLSESEDADDGDDEDSENESDGSLPDLVKVAANGTALPASAKVQKKPRGLDADAQALRHKGNEHFNNSLYEEACKCYTDGLKLDASKDMKVKLLSNRAHAYNRLGRHKFAMQDCEAGLKLQPDAVKTLYRLAATHLALNEWKQCLKVCNRGLAVPHLETAAKNDFAKLKDAAADASKM